MTNLGQYHGKRDHAMHVPVCSRSGDIVEPLNKPQWFLKCSEMCKKALEAAEKGELKFDPKGNFSVWKNWLQNDK
jgi:valyl-tRNA synthetase